MFFGYFIVCKIHCHSPIATITKNAIAIIGSEELGVSPEALKAADDSLGRVSIPLLGNKSSLNVANATSILLQRWSEHLLKG